MSIITVILLLLGLHMVIASRLRSAIQSLAMQGVLLGCLPLLESAGPGWREALLALITVAVKGVAIPLVLSRAVRRLAIRQEMESLISRRTAIVLIGSLAVATFLACGGNGLAGQDQMSATAGLTLLFAGLLSMTSRVSAIGQVIGFVVLENGIFLFGAASGSGFALPIELGIFLDLFVAVFLMGILMFKIQRAFNHTDLRRMHALKD
jgi:hydrogenase-4 component E